MHNSLVLPAAKSLWFDPLVRDLRVSTTTIPVLYSISVIKQHSLRPRPLGVPPPETSNTRNEQKNERKHFMCDSHSRGLCTAYNRITTEDGSICGSQQATNVAKALQKELNNSSSNGPPPDYSIRIWGCARGTWPKVWTQGAFQYSGLELTLGPTQLAAIDSQVRTVELGEAFLVDIDET